MQLKSKCFIDKNITATTIINLTGMIVIVIIIIMSGSISSSSSSSSSIVVVVNYNWVISKVSSS